MWVLGKDAAVRHAQEDRIMKTTIHSIECQLQHKDLVHVFGSREKMERVSKAMDHTEYAVSSVPMLYGVRLDIRRRN